MYFNLRKKMLFTILVFNKTYLKLNRLKNEFAKKKLDKRLLCNLP